MTHPHRAYTASRVISAATAAYGLFAAVKPNHLPTALEAPEAQVPALKRMAYTYAGRDLSISALAFTGSADLIRASMVLRIIGDFSDAAILSTYTDKSSVRTKVLATTLGWAAVNIAALAWDERRSR